MAYLALVRHGKSEYNDKGIWAGWLDPELVNEGIEEAKKAGNELQGITFDFGYTSILKRAKDTLSIIKKQLNQEFPVTEDKRLNERDYGDLAGKNKWEIKEKLGEEEFMMLRRSWDYPVPNGESLKQVYDREIPYFEEEILSRLKKGENIIIASSGNALRALVKYLENINESDIASLEIATGEIYLYQIGPDGNVLSKELRSHRENTV